MDREHKIQICNTSTCCMPCIVEHPRTATVSTCLFSIFVSQFFRIHMENKTPTVLYSKLSFCQLGLTWDWFEPSSPWAQMTVIDDAVIRSSGAHLLALFADFCELNPIFSLLHKRHRQWGSHCTPSKSRQLCSLLFYTSRHKDHNLTEGDHIYFSWDKIEGKKSELNIIK